jgi:hypothetical protein
MRPRAEGLSEHRKRRKRYGRRPLSCKSWHICTTISIKRPTTRYATSARRPLNCYRRQNGDDSSQAACHPPTAPKLISSLL